jgi:hypothetical protein
MERCESSTDSTHFICVDRPLACLITFSCYGWHLHGSENGSVDRDHNLLGGRYLAPERGLLRAREKRMLEPAYALDDEKRRIVLAAIRRVCTYREWTLIAAHVRMSHVHVVVAISFRRSPCRRSKRMLLDFSPNEKPKYSSGGHATAAQGICGRKKMWLEQYVM